MMEEPAEIIVALNATKADTLRFDCVDNITYRGTFVLDLLDDAWVIEQDNGERVVVDPEYVVGVTVSRRTE